ncbi:uncharacterized protein LOC128278686 [Anopheles cruzii]|uniref:uncharacterized protein LOC128278686 n=1 Tax=Anopheles cruzii TaxID=68878 RepID=UPI0022EC5CB6|nr:uncharacterized protein LOC128278686 [Anopheles cruzii]
MAQRRTHQGNGGGSGKDLASSATVAPDADPSARSDGDGRDTAEEQQLKALGDGKSRQSAGDVSVGQNSGTTKATVHINGVAVDHFHQNSDVDEERRSLCQNSDIHGFISYSSDSSMIELNLKFRKCACNENIINISKENLQQMQRSCSPPPTEGEDRPGDLPSSQPQLVTSAAVPERSVFRREGKSKKLLALNKDNLNSLVRKLNDTANSSSSSCTKCRLSLDVNHILTQIVSIKTTGGGSSPGVADDKRDDQASPRDESIARRAPNPLTIDASGIGLRADDSLIGSSASPLPSPNSPIPLLGLPPLERRHSETVERRSIGVQHAAGMRPPRKRAPMLRTHGRSMAQAEEIIIISDEFRRQSLRDQQSVRVQKSVKKISKSMECIDKRNPPTLSLRPVAIRSFQLPNSTLDGVDGADEMLTIVVDTVGSAASSVKSISKSVDNVSVGSGNNVEPFAQPKTPDLTAASDSVELIFISDEFVKRKSKSSSDVIIVESAGDRKRESAKRRRPVKHLSVSGVEGTGDRQRKVIGATHRTQSTEGRIVKSATIPVAASPAAKAKDTRRKTTVSNSNSFLTYEEPFSPDTLESKDIGQMFAEAAAE